MISTIETQVACVEHSDLYLDPLMEDPAEAKTAMQRRREATFREQAAEMCGACPILEDCLYEAVTKFDVTGFVAGTTAAERSQIRALLGIEVNAESLDIFAGVNSGQKFDGDEIYRLRQTHPDEPLRNIAERAGCSLSTVKRHLRRISREGTQAQERQPIELTKDQVMAAAHEVKYGTQPQAA